MQVSNIRFLGYLEYYSAAKTCGPPPEGVPGVEIRVLKTGQNFGQNCSTNDDWIVVSGCEECGDVEMKRIRCKLIGIMMTSL